MPNPPPAEPDRKATTPAAKSASAPGSSKPPAPPPSARETQRPTDSTPMQSGSFAKLPMRFGRYQIEKLLGRGNMGAVYLAMDTQLGRKVAIKIPKVSASGSQKLLKRLETEAKAAAQVEHPSVCPVYDWGQIDGTAYIAMQYVEGETLKDHLKARQKTPQEAVALIVQLAEGLAEAHARKICHRDLKPDNIKLNKRGVPVIMDFGLAKLTSRQSSDASATQAGTTLGTPAYMSPEQANGQVDRIDHRSDIYALGVIFYEMLTGQWPFMGSAMQVMGQKTMQEAPSPLSVKSDLDPAVAAICQKMLAKEREARYVTAEELLAALREVDPALPRSLVPDARSPLGQEGPGGNLESGLAGLQSLVLNDPYSEFLSRNARKRSDAKTSCEHPRATVPAALAWIKEAGPAVWTAIGVALLFFVGVGIWASGVIKVQTKEGVLVVEVNVPDVEVFVDGEQVDVTWENGKEGRQMAQIRVQPGQRQIKVSKDGFAAVGSALTIEAGDRRVFTAKLEAVEEKEESTAGRTNEQPREQAAPKREVLPIGPAWTPLFNGNNLQGFIPGPERNHWSVADGLLSNQAGGRIFTERTYTSFLLKFEFKITSDTGASIDLWSFPDSTPIWVFLDNTRQAMAAITYSQGEGKQFNVFRLNPPAELRPEGEWNDMTLEAKDAIITVSLNGKELGKENAQGQLDLRRPELPPTNRALGRIGFHKRWGSGTVTFRRIEIMDLSTAGSAVANQPARVRMDGDMSDGEPLVPSAKQRKPLILVGDWHADGDVLVKSGGGLGILQFGDPFWDDYDFSFDVVKTGGPYGAAARFRFFDEKNLFEFDLGAGGNTKYGFLSLPENRFVQVKPNVSMLKDKTYHVLVKARGEHFVCYLDDELMFTIQDVRHPRGAVGFAAFETQERFSSIKVTRPDGTVIWAGLPELPRRGN